MLKSKTRQDEIRQFRFNKHALAHLPADDQQLFEQFGQSQRTSAPYDCLHQAFEYQASRRPQAIAACHAGERITYGELNQQANKVAAVLAQCGVRPGDRVGVFVKRSIPMLAGILGTLKVGAAYVPQDARISPLSQMEYVARTADTKVVLTLSSLRHLVPQIDGQICLNLDDIFAAKSNRTFFNNPAPKVSGDMLCFVLFTSGTTGKPKGVKVTHSNVCNIILNFPGNLDIQPGMTVSQILNIAFDMAVWEIFGALSHGATLYIREKDIAEAVQRADVAIATPSILGNLDADRCRRVKVAAVAGEPCPRPLADKWASFCDFYNACGPTEVTIVNTMQRHVPGKERLTIGRPTPNNTVYVLDKHMKPCPIGEVGEMWAGGKCVSAGYFARPELTKERYQQDPFLGGDCRMFRTGDLGRWTEDGELEHFGRSDDQVKIRGFRVELDSVSAILESVPNCTHAVTLKIDDRTLASFVTPESVDTEAAKQAVAEALPYYCVPAAAIALDELPMTDRGKVDKRQLTRLAAEQLEKPPAQIQPVRNREKTLARSKSVTNLKNLPAQPRSVENLESFHKTSKSANDLEDPHAKAKPVELPPRDLYHAVFRHPLLMPYNRLAVLVVAINVLIYAIATPSSIEALSNLVLANFAIAILIRRQSVINWLFAIATSVPKSLPLNVRWAAGKVYHFGGIHVGSFFSGTIWLALLAGAIARERLPIFPLLCAHLALLSLMMVVALPKNRAKRHNLFEIVGRFGTWSSLVLFWVQTIVLTPAPLVQTPQFWVLVLLTVCVILPWLRLKKVPVEIVSPSSHVALAKFDYGVKPFAGSSTDLSRNPLLEWHSFANVPSPNEPGFRLTISRAGDWTGDFIDDKPRHIWVKGIPTAGAGNVEAIFNRVVWVTTGSGIGPCLPHLLAKEVPSLLVWSTRTPRKTYGDALVDQILEAKPDAIIWDTVKNGKPDLAKLAYQAWKDFDAEAVICISNKKTTWHVVYEMESRGIPAFGAIWDS